MANFSMYSLISMRISDSSESNMNRARIFASWVLPTPVGPRENERADGFVGILQSCSVTLDGACYTDNGIVLADDLSLQIVVHAGARRPDSFSAMRCTGMPVIMPTTSPTWSTVTVTRLFLLSSSHCSLAFSSLSFSVRSVSRRRAASS